METIAPAGACDSISSMIDWRAVTGTSCVHAVLAVTLAGIFAPFSLFICMDCEGGWWFGGPGQMMPTFTSSERLVVFPIDAVPSPIVADGSLSRLRNRRSCPAQPPVDRLPSLLVEVPVDSAIADGVTACIHIDASGRPGIVRVSGPHAASTKVRLQRLLRSVTFTPAYRDGAPVGAWLAL